MGKLLGYIFKKDIKDSWKRLILPFLLAQVFLMNMGAFENGGSEKYIPVFVTSFVFGIAAIIFAFVAMSQRDNRKFFGEGGAFYSGLPVSPNSVVWARILDFTLVVFLSGLFMMILIGLEGKILGSFSRGDLKDEYVTSKKLLSPQGKSDLLAGFGFSALNIFVVINMVIAANSVGSEKNFRNMGNFGPFLVFVVYFAVFSFVFKKLNVSSGYKQIDALSRMMPSSDFSFMDFKDKRNVLIFLDIISFIYCYFRSKKSNAERLSVK